MISLAILPLDAERFAPFGSVLETTGAERRLINEGSTERFHALATADTGTEKGKTIISLFRGQPREFPYCVRMMERHPLGSQAFFPLSGRPWIALVAPDEDGAPGIPHAFLVHGHVGLQYGRNVWHHPLIATGDVSDFLVVDREGPGNNLEERDYPVSYIINAPEI